MEKMDTNTALRALKRLIKRAGISDQVMVIAKATVPIIKFATKHGYISIDISLHHTGGVAAGNVVLGFLESLPALRPLVLVIRAFLDHRSMNQVSTGGLGSYSTTCLAISFLQMSPKIRAAEIHPSNDLGALVVGFFELYGCHFKYRDLGISIRDGGSYFHKTSKGWGDPKKPHLLCIEDPTDTCS